jgi:hypothetical protein
MLEIQLKVKINGGKVSLDGFVDAANVRLSNAWSSSTVTDPVAPE